MNAHRYGLAQHSPKRSTNYWGEHHYAGTNSYVGISSQDDKLRYMGSASNNQMLDLGSMATWKQTAGCQ
ncbi:MAG: hypothetical protein V4858_00475 [Pseudomonadota bacterium]